MERDGARKRTGRRGRGRGREGELTGHRLIGRGSGGGSVPPAIREASRATRGGGGGGGVKRTDAWGWERRGRRTRNRGEREGRKQHCTAGDGGTHYGR